MTTQDDTILTIPDDMNGIRLDKALSTLLPDYSRSRLQSLIKEDAIRINGQPHGTASYKVVTGDVITLSLPEIKEAEYHAENIPLDVIYEDEHLIVINKPAGMVTHPAPGHSSGTFVNALLHHCKGQLSGIGGVERPGIVHRLDKDTSGLMIAAKNDAAHEHLSSQLADRSLSRTYVCLVWEKPTPIKATIDRPVGRARTDRMRMTAKAPVDARSAQTHYHVLETARQDAVSLVECKLETGRTHQIRVHMQYIGHPLLGDPLYGAPQSFQESRSRRLELDSSEKEQYVLNFPRQALHARNLEFIHPVSEETISLEAPLPDDLKTLIDTVFSK